MLRLVHDIQMKPKTRTVAGPLLCRRSTRAITLIEALVVLAVIALLLGMLLPALRPPRVRVKAINCVNNLKQVGIAFRIFATDHHDLFPQRLSTNAGGTLELDADIAAHFRALSNELAIPKMLACPLDSRPSARDFGAFAASNVSYFLGMEADEMQPQMILSGDDHLTTNGVRIKSGWLLPQTNLLVGYGSDRHAGCGYVVMSDGSAMQLSPARLEGMLRSSPNFTNRFLLP